MSLMEPNPLRQAIETALEGVHIEDGSRAAWTAVADNLEAAIREKTSGIDLGEKPPRPTTPTPPASIEPVAVTNCKWEGDVEQPMPGVHFP